MSKPVKSTSSRSAAPAKGKTGTRSQGAKPSAPSRSGARPASPSRPARPGQGRSAEGRSEARPQEGRGAAGPRPEGRSGTRPEGRSGARPEAASAARPGRGGSRPAAKGTAPTNPAPRPAKRRRSDSGDGERLQKILAHAGIASRRACEELILEGHVQINGVTVTELGTKADPYRDEITVNYQPIRKEAPVYLIMNKPKGYVTTVKDDEGRPTVMALLRGIPARVYPVGRLDFQSEGMLLLTNDGALAHHITSPDFHIPKIYLVKVHRTVPPETLDELRGGFRLDGRRLKPCDIEVMDKQGNPWLKVTLTEGKNQQIRRMFAAVGHPVHKLRRIQFGPIADPALKPGEWRFLSPQELAALKAL